MGRLYILCLFLPVYLFILSCLGLFLYYRHTLETPLPVQTLYLSKADFCLA